MNQRKWAFVKTPSSMHKEIYFYFETIHYIHIPNK